MEYLEQAINALIAEGNTSPTAAEIQAKADQLKVEVEALTTLTQDQLTAQNTAQAKAREDHDKVNNHLLKLKTENPAEFERVRLLPTFAEQLAEVPA